jgi:uncharacterized protein (TIGR03435 family)
LIELRLGGTPAERLGVAYLPLDGGDDLLVPGRRSTRLTSRTLYERRTIHNEGSIITANGTTIAELVSELEPNVDKPIVEKTGLTGLYQFTLQLPRDEGIERALRALRAARGSRTSADAEPRSGVSVFTSLESLGTDAPFTRVVPSILA